MNFIPTDIDIGNHDDLPDLLLHPSNLRLVQKFVREWQRYVYEFDNRLNETVGHTHLKADRIMS